MKPYDPVLKGNKLKIILLLFLFSLSQFSTGQECPDPDNPSLQIMTICDRSVRVNEQFIFGYVSTEKAESISIPHSRKPFSFNKKGYAITQDHATTINGELTSATFTGTYYIATIDKPGTYSIPEVTLRINGKNYKSESREIIVLPPRPKTNISQVQHKISAKPIDQSDQKLIAGKDFMLSIRFNARPDYDPEIDLGDLYGDASNPVKLTSGVDDSKDYGYMFFVSADTAGTYKMPSITAMFDGKAYSTGIYEITIDENPANINNSYDTYSEENYPSVTIDSEDNRETSNLAHFFIALLIAGLFLLVVYASMKKKKKRKTIFRPQPKMNFPIMQFSINRNFLKITRESDLYNGMIMDECTFEEFKKEDYKGIKIIDSEGQVFTVETAEKAQFAPSADIRPEEIIRFYYIFNDETELISLDNFKQFMINLTESLQNEIKNNSDISDINELIEKIKNAISYKEIITIFYNGKI